MYGRHIVLGGKVVYNKAIINNEKGRCLRMTTEELRQTLLDEIYAGAFSGMGAMILDEDRIRNAGVEELEELAREYGL